MNAFGEKVAEFFNLKFDGTVEEDDNTLVITLKMKTSELTVEGQNNTWLMFSDYGARNVRFEEAEEGYIRVVVSGREAA